ncbi:EcsC family protein [Melghirimyces algeriensis]|uniref:EcsC protein family protein n=1 Tax=Melghirimyces algeriensis TaxID=910412 RepID=A0A521E4E5_9BACL|nr:EcsC family protein [Melghirimyces algeriensis]SMO78050.1 EcsC protein family protein [Melghirimyces algeriensis]
MDEVVALYAQNAEDSQKQLEDELQLIIRWENEQKDLWFWERIGRYPFVLLDRITPRIIQKRIGKLLDELGAYIQTGGQYLINEQEILDMLADEAGPSIKSLSLEHVPALPLTVMNRVSDKMKEARTQQAIYQGAATGLGGVFTLAIDIPYLLGLSLKIIQEMALSYGYNPREKKERIFIVQCLQFASADYVGKQAVLKNLSDYHHGNAEPESFSQIQGWREVITVYRDNYGWKKLFQMIPIAGALFGAWMNKSIIEEVAEAGQMLYRKRRILEKLDALRKKEMLG